MAGLVRSCFAGMLVLALWISQAAADDQTTSAVSKYEGYLNDLYAAMSCGIDVSEELVAVHNWSKAELTNTEREDVIAAADRENREFVHNLTQAWIKDYYNPLEDVACIRFRDSMPNREWPSLVEDDPVYRQMVMQACISFIPAYCPLPGNEVMDRMNDVTRGQLGRSLDPSELGHWDWEILAMWGRSCGFHSFDASLDKTGLRCLAMMNEMLAFGSYGSAAEYAMPDPSVVTDWHDDLLAYDVYLDVLIASRACEIENDARVAEVANWVEVSFDERAAAILAEENLNAMANSYRSSAQSGDEPIDCDAVMNTYLSTVWPSELP